jgi:acyl-CoA dehydrogenase
MARPDSDFYDLPVFSDEHRALRERADDWAAGSVAGLVADHGDPDDACRKLVVAMGETGFLKLTVPAGGGGSHDRLDVRSLAIMRETLARHDGLADFAFAMQGLGSGPISISGSPQQQRTFLPAVAEGKAIAAFALTEPDTGSDAAAIATTAEPDGDDYVLNGTKTWISNAGIADQYVVFARTGEAPGARGLSAFIVPAGTGGLSITERIDVIAPHPLGTVELVDCRVPAAWRIGKPGDGFRVAMATLDVFRTTVGAAALGFARRALDEAASWSAGRMIFGEPLSGLQMTQAKIADMATAIDAAALLIYRAAWVKDQGAERISREAAMAKMFATEEAQRIIDQSLQLHGGEGVRSGNAVERLYRDIRALRIYEGATEVQKIIIARETMKRYGG